MTKEVEPKKIGIFKRIANEIKWLFENTKPAWKALLWIVGFIFAVAIFQPMILDWTGGSIDIGTDTGWSRLGAFVVGILFIVFGWIWANLWWIIGLIILNHLSATWLPNMIEDAAYRALVRYNGREGQTQIDDDDSDDDI